MKYASEGLVRAIKIGDEAGVPEPLVEQIVTAYEEGRRSLTRDVTNALQDVVDDLHDNGVGGIVDKVPPGPVIQAAVNISAGDPLLKSDSLIDRAARFAWDQQASAEEAVTGKKPVSWDEATETERDIARAIARHYLDFFRPIMFRKPAPRE